LKTIKYECFASKLVHTKVTPLHEHVLNRVLTYITDQTFRVTAAEWQVDMPVHKAGDVKLGCACQTTEENLSDKPFEVWLPSSK